MYKKDKKIEIQMLVNVLVKVFLFPLFIVGMLLRGYDRLFKRGRRIRKRTSYNFWY